MARAVQDATRVDFVKGHGTENDFILVPDVDAVLDAVLDGPAVRRLTDRYSGVGADGLVRVVPTRRAPEVADQAGEAEWFMDYRNADGSVAEMCGNGVRVLARYLLDSGLASGAAVTIATRGGSRTVHVEPDGQYTVEMGPAMAMTGAGHGSNVIGDVDSKVRVHLGDRSWPAVAVAVPNPHAVVFLGDDRDDGLDDVAGRRGPDHAVSQIGPLARLGLLVAAPTLSPEPVFPDGANVEFVVRLAERHIALRVWERGVGETRSCGTGVCAAAWAAMRRDGLAESAYTVDVPGGRLLVTEQADGELLLTGPAELGVRGVLELHP